eukprot:3726384-Rhodomonas_salina.2
MLARKLPDCVAAEQVEVSVQIRAEPVPLQQDPGWSMAVTWPVIVNLTELSYCPGPETVGHVAVLQHALHMLLRNPDLTLSTSLLHGVVVACSTAHDDVTHSTPHRETLAPQHGLVKVHPDLSNSDAGIADEVIQQLLLIRLQPGGRCPHEIHAVNDKARKSSSSNQLMLFVSGANLTLRSGAPASANRAGEGTSAVAAAAES